MTFLNPWAFMLILFVLWIFKDTLVRKGNKSNDLFDKEHKRYHRQSKLILLSLLFTLFSLARPALTNEISQEKFDANEYIIAIDASYSMQMDDIKPSRYEVAKEIRKDDEFNDLYILILTAKGQSVDEGDALKAGANSYMTKPFDDDMILKLLSEKF